jgi:hypothetical protein
MDLEGEAEPSVQPEPPAEPVALVDDKPIDDKPEAIEPSKAQTEQPAAKESVARTQAQASISREERAAQAAPEQSAPATQEEAAPAPAAEPVASVSEPAQESAKSGSCDEVLCLLEGKACCGNAKSSATGSASAAEPAVDSSLPTTLGREQIQAGLEPIKGRIGSCGSRNAVAGAVNLKIKLKATGAVASVTVKHDNQALGECISKVVRGAKFAMTQKGTTVRYPVILR